jgi:hypothetical protein
MEKERKQIHEGNHFRASSLPKRKMGILEFPRLSAAFRTLKQHYSSGSLPAIYQSAGTTTIFPLVAGELTHAPLFGHSLGASISFPLRFWSFNYRRTE